MTLSIFCDLESEVEACLMSVTVTDVDAAAARLSGRIQHTPLLESLALNNLTAGRILVKADYAALMGSLLQHPKKRIEHIELSLYKRFTQIINMDKTHVKKIRGIIF